MRLRVVIACLGFAGCGQLASSSVPDAAPSHIGEGLLFITWQEDSVDGAHHGVSGSFVRDPQPTQTGACTTSEIDGCVLVECPSITPVDAGVPVGSENEGSYDAASVGTQPSIASAGVLTISGLLPQGQGSIVVGNSYPPYPLVYEDIGQRKLWAGGESIGIDFSGDAVPAIHQSIIAPTPVQLTQPSMVDGLVVDRASGFEVAWNGATTGSVKIYLQVYPQQTLTCLRDASTGVASIAPATLSELASGTCFLGISFVDDEVTDQGGWTLTTRLETFPTGMHFAQIQLQ